MTVSIFHTETCSSIWEILCRNSWSDLITTDKTGAWILNRFPPHFRFNKVMDVGSGGLPIRSRFDCRQSSRKPVGSAHLVSVLIAVPRSFSRLLSYLSRSIRISRELAPRAQQMTSIIGVDAERPPPLMAVLADANMETFFLVGFLGALTVYFWRC